MNRILAILFVLLTSITITAIPTDEKERQHTTFTLSNGSVVEIDCYDDSAIIMVETNDEVGVEVLVEGRNETMVADTVKYLSPAIISTAGCVPGCYTLYVRHDGMTEQLLEITIENK